MPSTRILYELVGVDRASPAFDRAGRSASGLERTITKVSKAITLAGGAVAAGAVAIGYESVKAATSFQASMEKIRTQAGGSQKDVAALSQQVLKLGTTTQQGPQALADSLYHLKSVGLDNVKAMQALRAASDLAAAGGASLEETTNAIAGAWRSGIKGANNFGQAAATVNAIIGAGNMRMEDFIGAIGTGILPAARTFGVSLKSVGAALALMTDEGIPADAAATRLRMSLSLLGAPSAAASKQLATIGLTGLQLANAMRGPQGIIGAIGLLKSHLDASGLSASQAAQLLSRAFGGGRSSSAILTLVNNLGVLEKKQQQINDTTSRYGGDVAAQRKTAAAQFALLRSNLDVLGVRIGLALLPPLAKFTGFLAKTVVPGAVTAATKIGKVFTSVIPVDAIKRDWHSLLAFLGLAPVKVKYDPGTLFTGDLINRPKPRPLRLTTADLVNLPRPAPLYAGDLIHPMPGGAFRGGAGLLDLMHPLKGQAAGGIAATLTGALAAVDWGKITAALGEPLGKAIGSSLGWIGQHGAVFVSNLIRALAGLDWVNIGKLVGGHAIGFALGFISSLGSDLFSPGFWEHHWWDTIIAAVSFLGVGKFGGAIAKVLSHIPILRIFAPLFSGLERITGPITSTMAKAGGAVWRAFLDGLRSVFPGAIGFLERETGLLGTRIGVAAISVFGKARGLARGIGGGILRGAEGLGRIVGGVIDLITHPFRPAPRWLVVRGSQAMQGLINGIRFLFSPLTSSIKWVVTHITSPFSGAGRWLFSAGKSVVGGLLSGIRAAAAGIGGWVKAHIVDPVVSAVKNFFGIHSPSTVMAGLGSHLMTGLFSGIMAHDPLAVVKKVFGSMPAALGHLVEKGLVSIASLPGRALRALGGLGGSVLGKIGGFISHLFGGGGGAGGNNRQIAMRLFPWPASMFGAFDYVEMREAGYNMTARNPSSGAYGMAQFINGPGEYAQWGGNANTAAGQLVAMFNYIASRYRNPVNAAAHERAFNWYGTGTPRGGLVFTRPTVIGVGDRPEHVEITPLGSRGARAGPLVAIHGDLVVQDRTDVDLIAQRLSFGISAAGLGG